MNRKPTSSEALVVGAGPAGLAAALSLHRAGLDVAIAAPRPTEATLAGDTRTFAALGGSVELLKRLDVWSRLEPACAPLTGIRIVDDRGGLLRAPEVLFRSRELGLSAFGMNIPQAALVIELAAAVDRAGIPWHDAAVTAVATNLDTATAHLASGDNLSAPLLVAADGRHSLARPAAGITTETHAYPQSALAGVMAHTRPHGGVSTEFHRAFGPLTTVPLPSHAGHPRSSFVWVDAPARIAELHALDEPAFTRELDKALQGLLGPVQPLSPRATFPLIRLEAEPLAQNRIALVGEAAHVIPPIGAQGLNLGLRDAATLHDAVLEAGRDDPGAQAVLSAYAAARSADVWTRVRAVDALNRSLLTSSWLPLEAVRGLGLHALAASATLRRRAMNQGLEPVTERPRLMQTALLHEPVR